MEKNNIIMIPTDFTEVADYAIEHAIGAAKMLGYKISVLHAINKETKTGLKKEKKDISHIEEKLSDIVENIKTKEGIKADYIFKEGSIFNVIPDVAKEIGANFLFMGTHGKLGVQHLIGSFAWKVVKASPVPIVVVQKKSYGHGYKNIIMTIDNTIKSKQKINWAVSIASVFGSTIHLTIPKQSDEFIKNKTMANLNQTKSIFQKNNVPFTVEQMTGSNQAKQLESYANKIDADLLMIMTNPEKSNIIVSPWDEQLLFNNAKIPVMCINPIDSFITVLRR